MEAVGQMPSLPRPLWLRLFGLAVTVAVAVFLALATYLQPGSELQPGLDSSWAYALNYIYQHKLVVGHDIFFTFGPLGFLEHTRALTHDMIYQSSIFWFSVSVLLNIALLQLAFCSTIPWWHRAINLVLVLALVLMANTQIQRLLLLLYVSVFLHWQSRSLFYLLLLTIASAICLLIKFSYGAAALAMTLPYLVIVAWRDRAFYQIILAAFCIPACCALVWLVIYGHLDGMVGYIQGGLEFSRGSTSAMALNPANEWAPIALYYAGFGGALWIIARAHGGGRLPLSLCFIGPLFIWSKYAFGREESGHLVFLMLFVFYLFPVMALAAPHIKYKAMYAIAMLACLMGWQQLHNTETGPPVYELQPVYYPPETFRSRLHVDPWIDIWVQESEKKLRPLQIPAALRERIGGGTVDIYPWESLVVAANKLDWVPRPVFQNYITYTPFLDRANQDFYASAKAPQFLVWHYHDSADIDNRFPFSSDPLTLQAMLQHYRQVACEGQFCLWEKAATPQLHESHVLGNTTTQWDTWIQVPATETDVLRAGIAIKRTLMGKLNLALWKEGGVSIDYRLRDGSIQTHTLVVDNAVSGVWVSPYVSTLYQLSSVTEVSSAALAAYLGAGRAEGYIEDIRTTPNGVRVMGWGLLPFRDTRSQVTRIIFFNEQHAYETIVANRNRPGISEHFGKTGEVDLDNCGFDAVIPTRDMVPGEYSVRFVVENEGLMSVVQETGYRAVIGQAASMHNVEAIRLRTSRPWAFAPDVQLDWQGQAFVSRPPW